MRLIIVLGFANAAHCVRFCYTLKTYGDRVFERSVYLSLLQKHIAVARTPQHALERWQSLAVDHAGNKSVQNEINVVRVQHWYTRYMVVNRNTA